MRKWMVFLGCFLLFFTSCSTNETRSTKEIAGQYVKDFSFTAAVVTEKDSYRIEGEKNGMSITVSVKEPKELRGLSITWENEKTKASFEGMEAEFMTEALPESAPFRILGKAFSALQNGAFSVKEGENGLSFFGNGFSGVLQAEDLSLLSLSVPAEKKEFFFSDFKFSEEK